MRAPVCGPDEAQPQREEAWRGHQAGGAQQQLQQQVQCVRGGCAAVCLCLHLACAVPSSCSRMCSVCAVGVLRCACACTLRVRCPAAAAEYAVCARWVCCGVLVPAPRAGSAQQQLQQQVQCVRGGCAAVCLCLHLTQAAPGRRTEVGAWQEREGVGQSLRVAPGSDVRYKDCVRHPSRSSIWGVLVVSGELGAHFHTFGRVQRRMP